MTPEQRNTNSEDTTKHYEVGSTMVQATVTNFRAQRFDTKRNVSSNLSHSNNSVKESAFTPVGLNSISVLSNGVNNLRGGQKRPWNSGNIDFLHSAEKRFKSNDSRSIYEQIGQQNPIYYHPSFKQNVHSSNGLNGSSQDVLKKIHSKFDLHPDEKSRYFDMLKSRDSISARKEMRKSNWQTSPVEFRNSMSSERVGEAELERHNEQIESFSKNTRENAGLTEDLDKSVENESNAHENSNSGEFISLDSTKSSFLTLIRKMRPENSIIPCPFCPQIFSQYPELKRHVQTHKHAATVGNDNGIHSLYKGSQPATTCGNSISPPVSSSPCPPNHRFSVAEGEGSMRATSVIQFAEKKQTE